MFLVLLRMAIGWHFLYEGLWKIESKDKGAKAFSAESYLRNATGPLAPRFRALVPDADSLGQLDPALLKQGWAEEVARIKAHYGFDSKQQAAAEGILRDAGAKAETWFR